MGDGKTGPWPTCGRSLPGVVTQRGRVASPRHHRVANSSQIKMLINTSTGARRHEPQGKLCFPPYL